MHLASSVSAERSPLRHFVVQRNAKLTKVTNHLLTFVPPEKAYGAGKSAILTVLALQPNSRLVKAFSCITSRAFFGDLRYKTTRASSPPLSRFSLDIVSGGVTDTRSTAHGRIVGGLCDRQNMQARKQDDEDRPKECLTRESFLPFPNNLFCCCCSSRVR